MQQGRSRGTAAQMLQTGQGGFRGKGLPAGGSHLDTCNSQDRLFRCGLVSPQPAPTFEEARCLEDDLVPLCQRILRSCRPQCRAPAPQAVQSSPGSACPP